MSERTDSERDNPDYRVNEDQSRFFEAIGMEIPVGTNISFRPEHLAVLQGCLEGLLNQGLADRAGVNHTTLRLYLSQIATIGRRFAVGSNGLETAVTVAVGLGQVETDKIMPKEGLEIDITQAKILELMIQGYDQDEVSWSLGVDKAAIGKNMRRLYRQWDIDQPNRRRSLAAVAIATQALKTEFDKGSGLAV